MLKHGFKDFLAEANAVVDSVSVQDLQYLIDEPDVVLVDVRETVEREADGQIPGSVHVPRGLLEFKADPECPIYEKALNAEDRLVLYCGTGGRSVLAAKTLLDMGYTDVCSLTGGFSAWQAAKKVSR